MVEATLVGLLAGGQIQVINKDGQSNKMTFRFEIVLVGETTRQKTLKLL